MKTYKKWLTLALVSFLLFSCSPNQPGPTNVDNTPTKTPTQMIEAVTTETPIAETVIPAPLSTEDISTIQTLSAAGALNVLTVIFPDGSQVDFSSAELRALPESTVLLKDQQQATGIPVLAILDQAGWSRYEVNTISIQGVGLINVSKAQLDGNFLLVVGNSNIRFISPLVPRADWLTEVRIIVLY